MLSVKEDKSRQQDTGQIFVEIIDFEPTSGMPIKGRYGYWCDLDHIKVAFLRPLVFKFTKEVREILEEIDNKIK